MLQLLPLFFALSHALSITTPSLAESIRIHARDAINVGPLARTILMVPLSQCSKRIKYVQKTTNTCIEGLSQVLQACDYFDTNFQSRMGVNSAITHVSTIAPQTLLVSWNVTWIPTSALWLERVGKVWPDVQVIPTPYNHLSNRVNMFSWKAIGKLLMDTIRTGKLRVPLSCIEGTSEMIFSPGDNMLVSISEELSYAQDLRRGALQNKKCSDDLKLFLETGRRISTCECWDETVTQALPWSSVPGSNPLDMTPMTDGEETGSVIFLGVSAILLLVFANVVGPHLIGQSLFEPTQYFVDQQHLSSMF